MLSAARSRSAYLNFLSNAAPLPWPRPAFLRRPVAARSLRSRLRDGYPEYFFETAGAQDFPRELDEIQCPKPFDVGFRPDIVNHHLADGLKVLAAFTGKQE